MPFPTTGSNTELQAVNQILASVGQAPVSTLDTEEILVFNEVSRITGFLASTTLFTNTNNIPAGTYISGIGVANNTAIATTETVFSTTGSISSNVLTSPSPYIPKNTFITGTGIANVLVQSGPSGSGPYTYTVSAANASSTTLTLDPILYEYTTNISQTVGTSDSFLDLSRAIVTQKVETQTNPDVAISRDTLKETSREVQSEGWAYNTERNYDQFKPDGTKKIPIPNNVIQMDLSQDYTNNLGRNVVNRAGYVYDTIKHTDIWDTDETLYFDVVWERDYSDIPQPIQAYIVARAAATVSSRIIGDPNQYQMLQQKEAYTRSMALEYDCNQGDHSFFGAPKQGNYYKSYSPFDSLIR